MLDQPVRSVMERRKFLKAAPETLVSKAARLMAAKNVGAIMVVEADVSSELLRSATSRFESSRGGLTRRPHGLPT